MPPKSPPVITLSEAVSRYMDHLANKGRSTHTISDAAIRLRRFISFAGNAHLQELKSGAIADFLRRYHGRNAVNYWRTIRQFLRFAKAKGWMDRDPTDEVEKPDCPTPRPATLSPVQVDLLLSVPDARILPYLSIGIFAGLRPGELAALNWSEVDIEAGTILVLPETSKVRRSRFVPIGPRLSGILSNYSLKSGPILPVGHAALSRLLTKAYRGLGIRWQQDIMRHTYATMRIALDGFSQTAADMGTSEAMLIRHYRGLARRSDAVRFFSPTGAGQRET